MSDCQRVYVIFLQPVRIWVSLKMGYSHHFPYENDRYWKSPATVLLFFRHHPQVKTAGEILP